MNSEEMEKIASSEAENLPVETKKAPDIKMNSEEMEKIASSEAENLPVETKKDHSPNSARKRKLIYERGTDSTLEFENGEQIHINKTALALESEYFDDVFFGSSPNANFKINDFDRETFQTFLDCWFGFKEYSVLDALMIYPIAHTYRIEKCLENCISVLKPTEMNENVCLSLNLALFFECEELINHIILFIKIKVGVVSLIENRIYLDLLEPKTVSELINHVRLDSYIWSLIYDWGIRHLESRSKDQNVRSFFADNGILAKIALFDFESIQSIFDFHKLTNENLLDSNEILYFLKKSLTENNYDKSPENSSWFVMRKGEEIKETIFFKNSLVISSCNYKNGLNLNIKINYMYSDLSSKQILNCKVRLFLGSRFSKSDEGSRNASTTSLASIDDGNKVFGTLKHATTFLKLEEKVLRFRGEMITFSVKSKYEFMEVKSMEITYKFLEDTRILKTSLCDNFRKTDDLYFTKDAVCSEGKKQDEISSFSGKFNAMYNAMIKSKK